MKSKWVTECAWRFDGYAVASDKLRYLRENPIRMTRMEFYEELAEQRPDGATIYKPSLAQAGDSKAFDRILSVQRSLFMIRKDLHADASMWGWPVVFVEGTT